VNNTAHLFFHLGKYAVALVEELQWDYRAADDQESHFRNQNHTAILTDFLVEKGGHVKPLDRGWMSHCLRKMLPVVPKQVVVVVVEQEQEQM
jgi:hypothetical protein